MKELLLDIKEELNKLNELCDDYEISNFERKIDIKLKAIEYKEKYDIDLKIRDFQNVDWVYIERLKGTIYIGKNMKVLNSDVQPDKNEELIQFSYPTGAYIFGNDNDKEVFKKFFDELKKYNFKYIDNMNRCLYFELKEGSKLFKDYDKICKKYQELYGKRLKEREIEELKRQIADLESKGE